MIVVMLLNLVLVGILQATLNPQDVPSRSDDGKKSVLDQDAQEVLQELNDRLRRECEGQTLQIDLQFSLGEVDAVGTIHRKRTILELGKHGIVRERVWELDEHLQVTGDPIFELLNDGVRQIVVFREELPAEEGESGAGQSVLHVIYYPFPTLSESHGMRGDGLLLALGRTGHYTSDELSILQHALDGDWTSKSTGIGTCQVESNSRVGKIRLEIDLDQRRLLSLECLANQPDHWFHGVRLADGEVQMASQAFWDVEYESRSDSTEERIVAYSFKSTRQMIDRKPHQFQGRVAVEWLANPPLDALDLQAEIPFEIQIPDGTEVGVLGSSVIQYRIFQRRLEVLFNRELEPQIKQVNAVFRRSQSQLSRPLLISEDTAEESSWRSGWPKVGTTALCGVVSAFAVANYWDEATSIDTWISPDYVRSPKGSRIEDLEQAAKEHGLSTAGLSGLNVATLCSLDMPAILHIRSRVEAVAFDHWVVFFGVTKDGSYVILDPSHGVELISHAELAARFGGTSLLLAPDRGRLDVNIARFRNRAVLQAIIYSACFVLAAVAIHYLHGHFRKTYLLMVFGAMGLLALAFHSWNPDGFLRLTPSRTKLVAAFDQQEITKIGLLELQSLLESPGRNVILIDARFESEYSRGSLPNAINFPLDLTPQRQIQLIESLGHEDTIIVFCESAECPWSETIARRIAMYGYKKLMIYEGGHREWRNR